MLWFLWPTCSTTLLIFLQNFGPYCVQVPPCIGDDREREEGRNEQKSAVDHFVEVFCGVFCEGRGKGQQRQNSTRQSQHVVLT